MDKLRLFNVDLHISVIADVKDVLARLYGSRVSVDNISYDERCWVFGQSAGHMDIVNQSTWQSLDSAMVDAFVARYREELSKYDGFIVTHTLAFVRLYEAFDKPIIVVNSCRYDQPYCWSRKLQEWMNLNKCLNRLSSAGRLFVVSNNKADREYLLAGAGIDSTIIPSLCLYTDASHDHHVAKTRAPILYTGGTHHIKETNIAPRPDKYSWTDLFNAKGLVHIPYEMSTMSIFEQYSAGVPLYFPTKRLMLDMIGKGQARLQSAYWHWKSGFSPPSLKHTRDLAWWLERADYYEMPGVRLFDSLAELQNPAFFDVSEEEQAAHMHRLEERKKQVLDAWRGVFERAFPVLADIA